MRNPAGVLVAACAVWVNVSFASADYRIEEVGALAAVDPTRLKPGVIAFTDSSNNDVANAGSVLIPFEDWARARPVQKQFLSLTPSYVERSITVMRNGVAGQSKERLHMYVAEARFSLTKPPQGVELAQYASLPFLERVDPAIKHRLISPAELKTGRDAGSAGDRDPHREWCGGNAICLQSRYQLEGKLPAGIRLVNKVRESSKQPIAEYLEFQSEIRMLTANDIDQAEMAKLTELKTPVTAAVEQTIFRVNQIMQFAKFLVVLQAHPGDRGKSVVTAFMVLAIRSDLLEKKKEYERVPVLRNLLLAQVLAGRSSFNSGNAISAGLPQYTRNRIKAIAELLERENQLSVHN
jgi:hypothetical protein